MKTSFVSGKSESQVARETEIQWDELAMERERALRERLNWQGVDICSLEHLERNGREALGIFPKSALQYFYTESQFDGQSHDKSLYLLCPNHLQEMAEVLEGVVKTHYAAQFGSRAQIIYGKLITDIGGRYIPSNMPVEGHYKENVYQYFGFPELPTPPKREI